MSASSTPTVITLGGRRYVTGLSWDVQFVNRGSHNKSLRTMLSESHATAFVPVSGNVTVGVGALLTQNDANTFVKSVSAAALAATCIGADRHVIFIEPIDDEKDLYWYCAIDAGVVNVHTDFVGNLAAVTQEAIERKRFTKTTYEELPHGSFQSIVGNAKESVVNAARIRKVNNKLPLKVAFIVLSLGVLAILGYHQFFAQKGTSKFAAPSVSTITVNRQDDEKEKKKRERLSQLSRMADMPLPLAQLEIWREALKHDTAIVNGWNAQSTDCDPSSCNVTYKRTFGTYDDIRTVVPDVHSTIDKPDNAVHSISLPPRTAPDITGAAMDELVELEKTQAELINLVNLLANRQILLRFDKLNDEPLLPLQSGKFEMSGARLGEMAYATKLLTKSNLGRSLHYDLLNMTITDARTQSWKIVGNTIFRKAHE